MLYSSFSVTIHSFSIMFFFSFCLKHHSKEFIFYGKNTCLLFDNGASPKFD